MQNQLICIVGPTASGKTALSVALAQMRGTEIISADSMQIYIGMDIGTAKPSITERQGIPHHMLDICPPEEHFSVARYVELADCCAQDILRRGMVPIVCGGTGLYLDALIAGNTFCGDEALPELRHTLNQIAAEQGNLAVHAMLEKVDPIGAAKLHPNNLKRVIRALEVYHQTGMTLDALNEKNRRAVPKYQSVKIGICPAKREVLYERIHARIEHMLEEGLLAEIETLFQQGKLTGTAAQAIGYKEYIPYFRGEASLKDCTEQLKQNSRNYAKRQLTWLRRDAAIHWVYYDSASQFDEALRHSTEILTASGL
jgi:tRNA dimethylallyltransferase